MFGKLRKNILKFLVGILFSQYLTRSLKRQVVACKKQQPKIDLGTSTSKIAISSDQFQLSGDGYMAYNKGREAENDETYEDITSTPEKCFGDKTREPEYAN